MRSFIFRLRTWLNNIPIQDTVDRRMASLLQVMLIGIVAIIIIAAAINWMIAEAISPQANLILSAIAILVVSIPILLLRRGNFHTSALIVIVSFFLFESFAVFTTNLRDIAETLSFFTLAIILAGLLISPRALVFTFVLSAGVVGMHAFQELSGGLGEGGVIVAGNFILLNGLISLFLNRFGISLRTALTSSHVREIELQKEIGERKRANDELHESEERYSKLINRARDIIFTISVEGQVTSLNPSFEIFTGWPHEEWVGRVFEDLIVEADRKRAREQFKRVLEGKTLRSLRVHMQTRSGEILIVDMNISPLHKGNKVIGLLGIARDMTQAQLAEEALVQSEDQYRRLIEHSPYGVIVHIQGKVAYLNPTAVELIGGKSNEEILGMSVLDIVHADSRKIVMQRMKDLNDGNEAPPLEEKFICLDGQVIDVEVTAYPFIYQNQSAVQVVFRDVTERKRAEEELSAREKQFHTLFENSPIGIGVADLQGNFLAFNAAILSPGKYDPEDIERVGNVSALYYDPQDRKEAWTLFQQHGVLKGFEAQFRRKDGSPYDALLSLTHTIFNGQPAVQAMVEDITERKQVERALRESESQLAGIIESAMDAIVTIDSEQKITVFNIAAEKMFGYLAAELVGQPIDCLLPKRYRTIHKTHIKRFGDSGEKARAMGFERPLSGLRANGEEFPIETSISQIEVEGNKLFTVILRDITERKHAEGEREQLIEELTTKNAELEHFVYTVSHDLKSPLVTIRGFLGYLEQDALNGNLERLRGDVRRISSAVERMQELLRDLLELSRIGRFVNPPDTVAVAELASEAIGLVEGQIRESGVKVELQPDLPVVYGDKVRLLEVFQNLLDNAVKYMGNQPEPRIQIGYRGEENNRRVLFVKDNGIGIAPEYRERIFGLFNKLDVNSEGTGVGLALVKRIIEFHGGRIWVESEVGKGSVFCFTLQKVPTSQ